MQNIKAREVITYVTMPRIVPRLKNLFTSGFGYIPFLMAQVYSLVRLIPMNHPYLKAENVGRYGIRHVVAEASRNLKFSIKNIDQFIMFFAMLAGFVILLVQLVLLVYALFFASAMASSFDTTAPKFDIAFNILDQIFGIPGIYCSTSVPGNCTDYAGLFAMPLPYHLALHGLFQFYSTGLLLIAVLIFLYFMVVVIVETAVTGTPFGQRFQNVWVPIRLVVAIGLLMPIQYGLNSGQYIVLYTAKYGSGLATNGWNNYNAAVAAHTMFSSASGGRPLGERYSHLAIPEAPDFSPLLEAMSIVHACAYAHHRLNAAAAAAALLTNNTRGAGADYPAINANYAEAGLPDQWTFQIQPFLLKNETSGLVAGPIGTSTVVGDPSELIWVKAPAPTASVIADPPYFAAAAGSALGFYYGSDIIIRFGEFRVTNGSASEPVYSDEVSHVMSLCGDIRVPISDMTDPGGAVASPSRGGADQMQQFYYNKVLDLWFNNVQLRQIGRTIVEAGVENDKSRKDEFCNGTEIPGGATLAAIGFAGIASVTECQKKTPNTEWRSNFIAAQTLLLKAEIISAWENYVTNSIYADYDAGIASRGWGGAGIWYNKIAEINGGWMDAVRGVPYMDKFPEVMRQVRAYKQKQDPSGDLLDMFCPTVKADSENSSAKEVKIDLKPEQLDKIAIPLCNVFRYWNPKNDGRNGDDLDTSAKGNIFISAINILIGTTGLMNIRGANQYLHPMAQLVAVGKGLVNSAILGMAGSSTSAFLGGPLNALAPGSGIAGFSEAMSKVFFAVAFLGLTAGFVLFYVLPFLPFLYFYFAVASWVKAIFEAMLGVPLWALAHMRIDGEGLPGDAAANGYFLLLEIFIRPILTVFGLLAAIIIFSVQVRILNLVWDLVVVNAAGFTKTDDILGTPVAGPFIAHQRNVLDQFFFTLVYTIVVYMLALSSFKLIDKIPDNILRWSGAGVSSYGDIDQDKVESITRYAATGGMTLGSQAAQAVTGASDKLGKIVQKEIVGSKSKA